MDGHQPKTREFVKSLGAFFQRDLISIPLIKKYPHPAITQRSSLKAATLELDTAAYPNIEYIAGNRLSVYPVNPADHVVSILKHLIDDISPIVSQQQQQSQAHPIARAKLSEPWEKFVQINGKDSVRFALAYLYDITTAPSRDLLRVMAESCSNKDHKAKLIAISKSDEAWEKWICQSLRTLRSTLDEFNSCLISAKSLFSELTLQLPRQYSISSIKSSKRFRAEIIVVQHKFSNKQIAASLQNIKERETISQQDGKSGGGPKSPIQSHPITVHIDHNNNDDSAGSSIASGAVGGSGVRSKRSTGSVRSLRSVVAYSTSPISSQQVKRVPSFSGPLMSLYAMSSISGAKSPSRADGGGGVGSTTGGGGGGGVKTRSKLVSGAKQAQDKPPSSSNNTKLQYDGLCSNYLLNLNPNDYIVCEFVENPRFTLKGNRERPIMMIGQDVGIVAYRAFWQQRALEFDRAQIFYTLFKDLLPKKFGEMQLVCLTGHSSRVEDLFKKEIQANLTHKIMSSVSYINRSHLLALLDTAEISSHMNLSSSRSSPVRSSLTGSQAPASPKVASTKGGGPRGGGGGSSRSPGSNTSHQQQSSLTHHQQQANKALKIDQKELIELGNRISKLLVDNNGCLYTCCDPQMTQAIEILVVESIARNNSASLSREKIMTMLPKWKGRKINEQPLINNKFLFTLENPFERAQIVQEIYDSTI